ncbi:shikimate kinase [Anaerobacterium chartisolvens]|uniref:Shikimate kinase n=1 Tax=Anaerobacterium chartisolvens TaxID=1297424 RepID=A0A369APF3_9FIRM|nr:shikimate kinase [Anaerobacterium chartisolvens]RCX11240.1 shikimate kinase [Anaerobacterium chartisolvens]
MEKSNVILTGMPGAGKSTLGVLLAKALKKDFIDTDLLIQKQEGMLLQDIINERGLDYFLSAEERAVKALNVREHVIATGGSVIYSTAAVEHLKRDGIFIFLNVSYDEIKRRLKNIKSRGIAMGKSQSIKSLYGERIALYKKHSDIIIDCPCGRIEDAVLKIKNKLESF